MLRDFSLRDFGASLNTVESYTNESSQDKIGLCETVNKQKCTHLGMFLASVNPKNRKDKSAKQTTEDKYNTHSLRKTFTYWFIEMGEKLKDNKDLHFDATILDLLKEKLKHSSVSVTNHYTDTQERAFRLICQRINIGLDVVENYVYGG